MPRRDDPVCHRRFNRAALALAQFLMSDQVFAMVYASLNYLSVSRYHQLHFCFIVRI